MLLLAACDLFSSEPDEGGVTHGPVPPVLHEFPRWSPDGTALLYYDTGLVSYNPDTHATIHDIDRRGIWVMNLETGQRRKLVSAGYADWSPDGSAIVFEAGQLYTARLAGEAIDSTSVTQITPGGRNFFPDWSPDGQWIAYDNSLCEGPKTCGVWLTSAGGGQHEHLADYGRMPSWHPSENALIFFTRAVTSAGEVRGDSLWRQELDTKRIHLISAVLGLGRTSRYPRYAPDGSRIAFQSDWQIWVMEADGSHKEQLTFDQGGMPDWSPDGQQIVYIGPQNTIWVMDADGANKKQLTFRPDHAVRTTEP